MASQTKELKVMVTAFQTLAPLIGTKRTATTAPLAGLGRTARRK